MRTLYVVGIGPGRLDGMTDEARAALERADAVVGYNAYLELVMPLVAGKRCESTPMMREVERCRRALEIADAGTTCALVCSGDAGVYGMAAPVLELAPDYPEVEVEVVAGVTAAQSGAARLGAPLGHDFAVISLSDLLTPWDVIERRLVACAWADLCVCLYNPRSKKRRDHLARAAEALLSHKAPETVCGWVRNIGRDGEEAGTLPLSELGSFEADMFTTIFVGNAATRLEGGRMVTPRGYRELDR
ncbi:precorrin-3B C(17)-methyltransferase [Collinsella sp. An2]|uniref:precorrin-3B C(17)-methyltransferase n=1 Tax=Collinsella sp. An2 TaxID=1965585 RepID=UPI000B39E665|nr:precorrin-3B C(17)-methyltransferase [Collinsella sp. An2]OUP09141.1 precorrin-3B C(17)-methyltransferase [Collinsella sp. An2]